MKQLIDTTGRVVDVVAEHEGHYWVEAENGHHFTIFPGDLTNGYWSVVRPTPAVGDLWLAPSGNEMRVLGVTDDYALFVARGDYAGGSFPTPKGASGNPRAANVDEAIHVYVRPLPEEEFELVDRL